MAKQNFLNDLYVGGVSLRETYGVEITGEAVYNAPARDVEFVTVPGRNGELVIDHGRFENIEVTYPCSIAAGYQANIDGLRAYLKTLVGYVEISDTYHPDEYRLGVYVAGLETTNGWKMTGGTFDLVFNCKPQRFLRSGDEPILLLQMGYIAAVGADEYKWYMKRISAELAEKDFNFSAPNGYGFKVESYNSSGTVIGTYTGTSRGPDYRYYINSMMTSGADYCILSFNQSTAGDVTHNVRVMWLEDSNWITANSAYRLRNPTLYTAKPLLMAHGGNGSGDISLQIGDILVYTELLGTSPGAEDFTTYVDIEDESAYYVDTATGAVTPFNYAGANRVSGLHIVEYGVGFDKAVLKPGTTTVGSKTTNQTVGSAAMIAYLYPRWWTI